MPSEFIVLSFIALGLVSGLVGGLLGIGGGVVTVPVLYFIFEYSEPHREYSMQLAVCTSLAIAFFTSLTATYAQQRKKAITIKLIILLFPGLFLGCILGSLFGYYLSSTFLRVTFATVAMLLGIYFNFPSLPSLSLAKGPNFTLAFWAILIGSFSTMLGIGGGSLTFPILLGYNVPAKNASANSSGATVLTTLFGTISYILITGRDTHIGNAISFIEIPSLVIIGITSLIMAPLGVKISHQLDTHLIKRIFGCCLCLVSLSMLFL